jgi:UDP-2-acetamido-3-amino-2,3-dideoxy-glucuronate N-acetyltransferase
MGPRIHPTAIIEDGVEIGAGTSVWDNVHIRRSTRIGEECIIGEKTYIAYDVRIGNRVKINAFVYVCAAVTIEDGVMISAGTVFTNDRFPRATTPDLHELRGSEPDEHTRPTLVREGATIGARAVIGNDLVIGRFAMVGMGAVVTKSVPDFHLVIGHPAVSVGAVCRCGPMLVRFAPHHVGGPEMAPPPPQRSARPGQPVTRLEVACAACGRRYALDGGPQPTILELTPNGAETVEAEAR